MWRWVDLRGRAALSRLRNVIGRVESSWRPASAEESFEIVRRRLFQPIVDPANFTTRDNVAPRLLRPLPHEPAGVPRGMRRSRLREAHQKRLSHPP